MTLLKNSGYCMSGDRLDLIEFLVDCPHSGFNIAPDLKIDRRYTEVPNALPCFRRDSPDAGRGTSYELALVSGISVGT
jgi:hypothetical protein